jgi:hypothetical protein
MNKVALRLTSPIPSKNRYNVALGGTGNVYFPEHQYTGSGREEQDKLIIVDTNKQQILFELDASPTQSRRPPASYSVDRNPRHKTRNIAIPSGDVSTLKTIEIAKILKLLLKEDPRVNTSYTMIGDDRYRGKTVGEFLGEKPVSYTQQAVSGGASPSLIAYHGTSSKYLGNILKIGLRPGNTPVWYNDLVRGFSDKNIYLTMSPHNAENYATRGAEQDQYFDKKKYQAVVLKIEVPDTAKMSVDEDFWKGITIPIKSGYRIKLNPRQIPGAFVSYSQDNEIIEGDLRDFWMDEFIQGYDGRLMFPNGEMAASGLYETLFPIALEAGTNPAVISALKDHADKIIQNNIKKSLSSSAQTFAYRGAILPKFIKVLKTYPIMRLPDDDDLTAENFAEVLEEVRAYTNYFDDKNQPKKPDALIPLKFEEENLREFLNDSLRNHGIYHSNIKRISKKNKPVAFSISINVSDIPDKMKENPIDTIQNMIYKQYGRGNIIVTGEKTEYYSEKEYLWVLKVKTLKHFSLMKRMASRIAAAFIRKQS